MASQFEVIELVGLSNESTSDAIKHVILNSNKTKPVSWFEVLEERGRVTDDGEIEFQVKVKVGRKI